MLYSVRLDNTYHRKITGSDMVRLLLLLGALFVTVCASIGPTDIRIDTAATCDEANAVTIDGEFQVYGTGDAPGTSCMFTFTAEDVTTDCPAVVCYMFDRYALFNSSKARLAVEGGTDTATYTKGSKLPIGPVCVDNAMLKVTVQEDADYTFNPKKPGLGYKFRLSIFHKCGAKGQVKNAKFEDVVDHAKGYHKKEEREEREKSNFIAGILLGLGMASIFLVVLAVAYCYTRNSPNRAPGRSVGMPKVGGFKKKMKPNQPAGHREVEMGVGYKAQDPDRKPESDPLLHEGKSSLETGAVAVTVSS